MLPNLPKQCTSINFFRKFFFLSYISLYITHHKIVHIKIFILFCCHTKDCINQRLIGVTKKQLDTSLSLSMTFSLLYSKHQNIQVVKIVKSIKTFNQSKQSKVLKLSRVPKYSKCQKILKMNIFTFIFKIKQKKNNKKYFFFCFLCILFDLFSRKL